MAWTIFEIFVNIFQGYIIQKFMESKLHITRPHRLQDVLCIASLSIFTSLYLFIDIPIPDTVGFIIPLIYALTVADDKWSVSVFWTAVLTVLFLSIASLSLHIFSSVPEISFDELMSETGFRIVFVLITNAVLALTLHLASKMKKDYSLPYLSVLLIFLLTNIALLVIEESLYTLQLSIENSQYANSPSFFWAYVGLCSCTILVVLIFNTMSDSVERENRYKAEASAIAQSRHYQAELEQMYVKLIATKHDLKQHIQALEEMVSAGGSEQAKEYLTAYQENLSNDEVFLTGSTGSDALLTAKALTMKRNHIHFQYTPYPLNELPICEPDFCTIIGNLLDNAIEGCLRIDAPHKPLSIHLTFSRSWDMFYIFCVNPCNSKTIRNDNGKWISSKEDEGQSGLHAIGIRSIERIARESEGRCSFEVKEGVFSAKVVIPFCEAKRTDEAQ